MQILSLLEVKVINYINKINFQSLIDIMKLTKENIKLLVNLGRSMGMGISMVWCGYE